MTHSKTTPINVVVYFLPDMFFSKYTRTYIPTYIHIFKIDITHVSSWPNFYCPHDVLCMCFHVCMYDVAYITTFHGPF